MSRFHCSCGFAIDLAVEFGDHLQELKCWGLCLVDHARRACVTGGVAGFRPVS